MSKKKPSRNTPRKASLPSTPQPPTPPEPPDKTEENPNTALGGLGFSPAVSQAAQAAEVAKISELVATLPHKLSGNLKNKVDELEGELAGHPTATIESVQRMRRFQYFLRIVHGGLPGGKENWREYAMWRHQWIVAANHRTVFRLITADLNTLGFGGAAIHLSKQRDQLIKSLKCVARLAPPK